MKMVKSLLLGTAAGLVAMTGAQAADLPVKAKPVQYVKICSLYGAGFYYIPGTDTCLKVGGYVRYEANIMSGGSFAVLKTSDLDARATTVAAWRARAYITADARSQTAYGTLRSYIAAGWDWNNGTTSAPTINANRAFIQWAGITAGHATSFFDFFGGAGYSNSTYIWGSDVGGGGQNVLAYTAQLGNGLSANLSLEDQTVRRVNTTLGGGDTWGGRHANLDVVGSLRVDQAWGSAQVMGAAHENYLTANVIDTWGYAVGAGLTVKLPSLGAGDNISAQVTYAKGALSYVGSGLGTGINVTSGGVNAKGPAFDGTVVGTSLDLTEGWSVVGGYSHGWNKQWKTSLYGSYGSIHYSDAAKAALVTLGDWSMWQVGSRTVWTPVANLDLSMDVMYNRVNTAPTGTGDVGWWQGMFRMQRNFYP